MTCTTLFWPLARIHAPPRRGVPVTTSDRAQKGEYTLISVLAVATSVAIESDPVSKVVTCLILCPNLGFFVS